MTIQTYQIAGRRERFAGSLANVQDFIYDSGHDDHSSLVSPLNTARYSIWHSTTSLTPQEFIANPHYSLYCFIPEQRRVLFVCLPSAIDLTQVPFAHQAQFEEATHVVTMPYALFEELAAELPPPPQPIFLYMSARSGSTLLSHAFNASGVVSSLSEPDVVTQFVHLHNQQGHNGDNATVTNELYHLAESTMRFLFRPNASHLGGALRPSQAVKFRSEGLQVMDLFHHTFPLAPNLFLYRDALGWVNSFHRIFTKLELSDSLDVDEWQQRYEGFLQTDLSHLRAYLAPATKELSLAEQLVLWWIAVMEWYVAQWRAGIPVLAVRYNDLICERELTLEAIFAHCGLPAAAVSSAATAFATDAQAGTSLARDNPDKGAELLLTPIAIRKIVAILQRHPEFRHPNYWAPGTLDLALYRAGRQVIKEPQTVHTA